MLLSSLKILSQHKYQTIQSLSNVNLPNTFSGVPRLKSAGMTRNDEVSILAFCPTNALMVNPLRIDMGRCIFCGECAKKFSNNISFSDDWRMWSYTREDLIVYADVDWIIKECIEPKIMFKNAFKLRQISAGGDGACEMELNAAGNVNFDMRRYGIEFTTSPRHADGVVITGPITQNMARATEITYAACAQPKVVIAVGSDAISGGLYADSPAIDRSFFDRHTPSLFVPGHPAHPLTFIGAVVGLMGAKL